jgi:tagaturonate reductase
MKLRCIPLLQHHYESASTPLPLFAFGFAAYLQFMKVTQKRDGKYFGERDGSPYEIVDDSAEYFYKKEQEGDKEDITTSIMKDVSFWGIDLTLLPHFADAVLENQKSIQQNGLKKTIETIQLKKEMV